MNLRNILLFIIIFEIIFRSCTNSQTNEVVTKLDGVYRYGDSSGEGPNGQVIIFTESDDSLLFYINISRGAPSYNMGTLYSRIAIKDGQGVFFSREFEIGEEACKWSFTFSKNILTIKTIGKNYECGFGGNVWADGIYKKVENFKQDFFIDPHGE